MGLRTASVRRPCVEVMAPALTESTQSQQFKLPSKEPAFRTSKLGDDVRNLKASPLVLETSSELSAAGAGIMGDCPQLTPDDNDKMGLQKTNLESVSKANDVDQLINNLTSNTDVDDLMQVIKSMENDRLSNPPADMIEDNLTIEKFLTDVDMMNISMDDQQQDIKETQARDLIADLKTKQNKIERRLDFLRRKIRKIQARGMGEHVAGEVAGVFEYVHRSLKRLKDASLQLEEAPKPMSASSAKTLLKKLEMAAALQANSVARQKHAPKYFGSGSSEVGNHRINVPGVVSVPAWPQEHKQELQKVAGLLRTELSVVQKEVDSEATESSSGGESCDEMQNYNNPHQQYLSIQKRALYKYATSRAAIASRWTWLQAQISDLEYRIRQHADLHRQIRASKGEIQLGGGASSLQPPTSPTAVNGYRGQLPGSSKGADKEAEEEVSQCARTRPLLNFKKRRLLQINGLHAVSKKAARPSTVRCGCVATTTAPCALCTGRTDPTLPRDPTDALGKSDRVALVDPSFHPVFSLPEDASYGIHCEAIMKNTEWQQRSTRMKSLKVLKNDRSEKIGGMGGATSNDYRMKKIDHRKKYNRLLKPSTVSALSAKIRNKIRGRKTSRHSSLPSSSFRKRPKSTDGADEEVESIGINSGAMGTTSHSATGSPSSSPLLHIQTISGFGRRNRANSYDIDNIVIPYSVAASTRVEKLQYKEIPTPKWRIADDFKCGTKNNGAVKNPSQDSDGEDLTEDAVIQRHDKSEFEEKKKFLSYLKLPPGHGRQRSHKRTDSLAESSGANTPDPMSPHPNDHAEGSPLTSPPATPLPPDETSAQSNTLRRRTASQSKGVSGGREDNGGVLEHAEVSPYDTRTFPLDEETYEIMLKSMPENHQFSTNARAQDYGEYGGYDKVDSPGTESTESAIGDEDPNDPEWVDMERSRDRHKR